MLAECTLNGVLLEAFPPTGRAPRPSRPLARLALRLVTTPRLLISIITAKRGQNLKIQTPAA